jgi:hypothetical protein
MTKKIPQSDSNLEHLHAGFAENCDSATKYKSAIIPRELAPTKKCFKPTLLTSLAFKTLQILFNWILHVIPTKYTLKLMKLEDNTNERQIHICNVGRT